MTLFAEKKKYADLSFKNIFVSNDSSGFASLDIGNKKYNYIIVSLGDAEHNWLATSELITQIRNAKVEGTAFYNGKIINKLFNDEENSLTVYSQAFEDATAYATSISQKELEQVKTADRMLSVVKARNLRIVKLGYTISRGLS